LLDIESSPLVDKGQDKQLAEKYAKYLHGDIQSTLSSSQMQMMQASEKGDVELGKSAIEKMASVLRRDHYEYAIGEAISPIARFQQIIDAWDGIATIAIDVDDSDISDVALLKVSDVIEELASNSIRHGGASEISVKISRVSDSTFVTYLDNGNRRSKGKPGLGSSLLKSLTTEVQLRDLEIGNEISFRLAD
jgi:signal transduction histidine kinase